MEKRGRPSAYSKEITEQIIERLSDGEPLRVICRSEGMPKWRTVYDWMARYEDFSAHIAHAREIGFDAIAEEALLIADTPCYGETVETTPLANGEIRVKTIKADMINHRKLQVDTRLKLLAKWNPKKYGDRAVEEHDGTLTIVNGKDL